MKKLNEMTKWRILLLCIIITAAMVTACGKNATDGKDSDKAYINSEYQNSGMLTISENAFDVRKGMLKKELGYGFMYTDVMEDCVEKGILKEMDITNYTTMLLYISEELVNGESQKGLLPELLPNVNAFQCFAISRIPENDTYGLEELEQLKKDYRKVEKVAELDGNVYYFSYNDTYEETKLSDADKENIKSILSDMEGLKGNICIFKDTATNGFNLNQFETQTLNGDTFSQEKFFEYDITMVNIWSTGCGPCIEEMPELQKIYEELPENVNLITICTDAREESELARKILKESGCEFDTLMPNREIEESLLNEILGYPTTVFVDHEGNIIGEPQMGVPNGSKDVKKAYLDLIEEYLVFTRRGMSANDN